MRPENVVEFWFNAGPAAWFKKDVAFDRTVSERFGDSHTRAMSGGLDSWCETALGSLAFIILLDQFSRNIYRGSAQAFASDRLALQAALTVIERGFDGELNDTQRGFAYMPLMHSEDARVQVQSVEVFARLGDANRLNYARRHKAIIDRFGRYPHRNVILGRQSTSEEIDFLRGPGSSF